MSDLFYTAVRLIGSHVYWLTGRPTVLGRERTRRDGPYLLAATHTSPYDVPLLIYHSWRKLDFVSSTDVFRNPLVAWFYGSLNAFPLDRSRPDAPTVRVILERLSRGRVVAMFPEGRFCKGAESVVHSRTIRPGIGRIAQLANVPIVPVVIVNSEAYGRFVSWLPIKRVRYGLICGEPIDPTSDPADIEQKLIDAYVALHAELVGQMGAAAKQKMERAGSGKPTGS